MKTLTKRALSALLAMLMLIGTMGMVASATDSEEVIFTYGEDDLVIADFSKEGTREDISYWRGDDLYRAKYENSGFRNMTEITDEVSLNGGTSLKMDHRYYGKINDVDEYYNKRIQRNFGIIANEEGFPEEKQTTVFYTVDDVLKYDYLYMWIYSGSANNQTANIQINDLATGMYPQNITIKMDYTGWKLHKINISSWELSSFNNTREGQEATAAVTDNIRFNLQTSGWSAETKADTVMYFDSIWLSNNAQNYKTDYDEEDYLIGDFTSVGGAAKFGGHIMKDCTEVTRDGRATAVRLSPADGTSGRLQAPEAYTISEILDKDNLYFWVYSSVANGQKMHIMIFDKKTGKYIQKKDALVFDWTGWKRVKISKDEWNKPYVLSSFNDGEVKIADEADSAYMWFSMTWGGLTVLEDTKLYFDSIWFTDKNLKDGETFTAPSNEWEKDGGYLIADFSSDTSDVAKWATFKYPHKDNITDEVTRLGKTKALKWKEFGDGTNRINSKLESPKKENLGNVLNYDYLYLWLYSEKSNNQLVNVVLIDATVNKNGLATKITMDYTGWKLHRIDISNLTLANFAATAADTDEWKLLLQGSGWSVAPLADTILYVDTIWLSNIDYEKEDEIIIKDFNDPSAEVTGTFNSVSGLKKKKAVNSVNTYGTSTYSAEIIPSEDNYTFATVQAYHDNDGMDISSMDLNNKYLNIIINAQNAENQKVRINFDGKMADKTTTMRVYKILNGIESGWQILSLPLAEFTKQNGGSSTEEILNNAGLLNSVDLHFPDWGNGREALTYREITEGETGTHIYNEETKKYVKIAEGETGTHVIANKYVSGDWQWDNIGNKVSADAKYYIDSIFLSDKDMSTGVKFTALNTITEEVALDGFKATFATPYNLDCGTDLYKNNIVVTKNGEEISKDDYLVYTEGKRLIVEFKNRLDFNSEYEIKVEKGLVMANGISTTEDSVLKIASLTKYSNFSFPMDLTDSGKVVFTSSADVNTVSAKTASAPESFISLSASTVINNISDANANVAMIVAVYNSNNQLAGMFKGNDVVIAAGTAGTVTATVKGEFANCTAKAFLWDMTTGAMVPYSAATPLN